jgi:hypothetical protein
LPFLKVESTDVSPGSCRNSVVTAGNGSGLPVLEIISSPVLAGGHDALVLGVIPSLEAIDKSMDV